MELILYSKIQEIIAANSKAKFIQESDQTLEQMSTSSQHFFLFSFFLG